MRGLHWIALVLVIVGALNWGLVGAFDFDLVAALFGADSGITNLVYVLVGIAGIVVAVTAATLERTHHPRSRGTTIP